MAALPGPPRPAQGPKYSHLSTPFSSAGPAGKLGCTCQWPEAEPEAGTLSETAEMRV